MALSHEGTDWHSSAKAHAAATKLFQKWKREYLLTQPPLAKLMSHSILHAVQSHGQSIWGLGLLLLTNSFQLPGDSPVLWFYRQCMGISDASSVWLPFQMLNLDPYGHAIVKICCHDL